MRTQYLGPKVGGTTDGLVSAYQQTQVTGAFYSPATDTAGSLAVPVLNVPVSRVLEVAAPVSEADQYSSIEDSLEIDGLLQAMHAGAPLDRSDSLKELALRAVSQKRVESDESAEEWAARIVKDVAEGTD